MRTGKITIKDVARKAGVSVGTASRAMNGAPGVLARTRDVVHAAAREMGYQPNAAARALRSRSSRLIGCLFSDLENPLYARLFNSLQDRLADEGFVTLITASSSKVDRERRAIQTFAERGLDAIVIAPGHQDDPELLQMLRDFPAPIFVVDRDMEISADRLVFDHAAAIEGAVKHLTDLGHQRILPVISHQNTRPGLERHAAFDAAMARAGLSVGPKVEPETPNASVFSQLRDRLGAPDRPTAMIVQGTQVLSSALNALAVAGLRVPQDMSLIAVGDSAMAEDHVPPITALRMDRTVLVDEIAGCVLRRIRGDQDVPMDLTLRYDLIERASCARVSED
ncbi:LacI family DNA-binding transcriptional regulator [Pseudooceanicola sp. MF1-13]|uniref:LacI family DNA-binding transcriptional regulator n=1 Tax=Pseudooceanicola sp. MF1-13 TaxID=3379095 RepID=UPI0038924BBB